VLFAVAALHPSMARLIVPRTEEDTSMPVCAVRSCLALA